MRHRISLLHTTIVTVTYGRDEKEYGDGLRGPCHFGYLCLYISKKEKVNVAVVTLDLEALP